MKSNQLHASDIIGNSQPDKKRLRGYLQMSSENNKQNAIAFYQMSYEGNPAEAVEKYVECRIHSAQPVGWGWQTAFHRLFRPNTQRISKQIN